jgi:hypothetical protein
MPSNEPASHFANRCQATRNNLVRISASNFTAGLVIKDDHVIRAAPILGYMIDWPIGRVIALVQRRGWSIEH